MNDPVFNQLRELSWRRKLSADEEMQLEAWLATHPQAREEWEAESGLNQALEQLPEAPAVSSNFTALVLQALERESAVATRQSDAQPAQGFWWRLRVSRWLPRAAFSSLLVGLGLLTYHQHVVETNRRAMAESVSEVYKVVVASNPEVIGDLDVIERISALQQPKADTDLLAIME